MINFCFTNFQEILCWIFLDVKLTPFYTLNQPEYFVFVCALISKYVVNYQWVGSRYATYYFILKWTSYCLKLFEFKEKNPRVSLLYIYFSFVITKKLSFYMYLSLPSSAYTFLSQILFFNSNFNMEKSTLLFLRG